MKAKGSVVEIKGADDRWCTICSGDRGGLMWELKADYGDGGYSTVYAHAGCVADRAPVGIVDLVEAVWARVENGEPVFGDIGDDWSRRVREGVRKLDERDRNQVTCQGDYIDDGGW